MIARLRGVLAEKRPGQAVVDVGGVGYEVLTSLTTFCTLPEQGEPVELEIVTNLRENALELFGFADAREKGLFALLRGVSGIGPRLALTILSGINPDELLEVLRSASVDRLVAVPGVGRKTAERLLVELKGKLDGMTAADSVIDPESTSVENDAVLALVALGYKRPEARKAVTASSKSAGSSIEALIKRSLARLA